MSSCMTRWKPCANRPTHSQQAIVSHPGPAHAASHTGPKTNAKCATSSAAVWVRSAVARGLDCRGAAHAVATGVGAARRRAVKSITPERPQAAGAARRAGTPA